MPLICAVLLACQVAAASSFQPPEGAARWRKTIVSEWGYAFGAAGDPAVAFAQIHQESRYREDAKSRVGAMGIAQFMPATARGLQANVSRLQELCRDGGGCPLEPRWAIRAMAVLDRDEYVARPEVRPDEDRLAMMLSGYNGGAGNLSRERARCRETRGCDPNRWWGQVEIVCTRRPDACRENREYPHVILGRWRPAYRAWLGK